ncbi:MAG TPA: ABC transporter permease [Actinocrinis sp.]|uniref:ABC transporter permease n=1 Tax=Actinocrinis sp. TaxID=1920516 RepID=UPI002DDCD5D0|nr:ABC transporter permease [Actinocrinis sp.]HEV2342870.1 ABC transporter permease [Actinocrinis sp.]
MFLTYLLRELRRRSRQALVVVVGLASAIGLVITVTAASSGVRSAQTQVLHSLYGVGTDLTVTQNAANGTAGPREFKLNGTTGAGKTAATNTDAVVPGPGQGTMAASALDRIAHLAGVQAVAASLSALDIKITGQLSESQGTSTGPTIQRFDGGTPPTAGASVGVAPTNLLGVDPTRPAMGPLSTVSITAGRNLAAADASADVAVVDAGYASQQSLKGGSKLTLSGTSFTVVGIATAPSGSGGANVYLPLSGLQALAAQKNQVTTVYVKAASASQIAQVQAAIQQAMPGATVTSSASLAGSVTGSLANAASLADNLGKWLAIAVLAAAFAVAVLFTVSAVGRRVREFGTLKALGWTSPRVVRQVAGEAIAVGLLGGALGIGLGFAGAAMVAHFAPTLTAATGSLPQGGGGQQLDGGPVTIGGPAGGPSSLVHSVSVHLTAPVELRTLLLAVLLAALGALIAAAFGGWRAASLRPAAALRKIS